MINNNIRKKNYYLKKYLIIPSHILRKSIIDTIRHDGIEHAGYLAFLSILSLFPSLIFLFSIFAIIGTSDFGEEFVHNIISKMPRDMANTLAPRINEIISGPDDSYLTIAILGIIWTASSSVEGCRTILNRAYRVALPPPYIFRRLVSIIEFFIIIFIIISVISIFVIAPTALRFIETKFNTSLHINYDIFYLRYIAIMLVLAICTSMLYYALPNAKQKITQTVPGSILAVILWVILEYLFSLYIDKFHQVSFVYGSIAGVIISLMLFYLISLVFILGAEFNYHFHRAYQVFLKDRKKINHNYEISKS